MALNRSYIFVHCLPIPTPLDPPQSPPPTQWVWKKVKTLNPPIDIVATTTVDIHAKLRRVRFQSVRGSTSVPIANFTWVDKAPMRVKCLEGSLKNKAEKLCSNADHSYVDRLIIEAKSSNPWPWKMGQFDVYIEVPL